MFKLKGHSEATLIHDTTSPCELWHRRLANINYKALPHVIKVGKSKLDLNIDHEGVCKGCAKEKNIKNPFSKSESMPSTSLSEYYIM